MRIGLATSEDFPGLDPDDAPLLEALGDDAEPAIWSDPAVDWTAYDVVLIRSVWDTAWEGAVLWEDAIRKTPAEGHIRVQPEHGGTVTVAAPTAGEVATAKRVLDAAGRDLLYARVDLVGDGLLIELEAIEPRFFFEFAPPQAAGKLARALRRRN